MPGNRRVPISSERGGMTTSAKPVRGLTSRVDSGRSYWARSASTWLPTSGGITCGDRCGSSRFPNSTMIASVPTSSGSPARPNSKNVNGRAPASAAASLTMMLTGVPVRASKEPACAEKASGISIWLGGIPTRTAATTTIGMSAATAPLTLINAVSPATNRQMSNSSRTRDVPPRLTTCWPAHAVTPVESSASETTKRLAMKMTVGSPNPASAWGRLSSPVAHSETATPRATIPIGTRLDMNATTASARMVSTIATGVTQALYATRFDPEGYCGNGAAHRLLSSSRPRRAHAA